MSTVRLPVLLVLLAPLAVPGAADGASPFDPRYPFDTAIIHVEFGGIMSGSATIWIDGDRTARHEKGTTYRRGRKSWTRLEW